MRRVLVIVLLVAVVCTGLFAVLHKPGNSTSEGVAKNFAALLIKKDADGSYNLFTDRYKKLLSQNDWSNSLKDGGDYTSIKVSETFTIENPDAAYPKDSKPLKVVLDAATKDHNYGIILVTMKDGDSEKIDEFSRYFK